MAFTDDDLKLFQAANKEIERLRRALTAIVTPQAFVGEDEVLHLKAVAQAALSDGGGV